MEPTGGIIVFLALLACFMLWLGQKLFSQDKKSANYLFYAYLAYMINSMSKREEYEFLVQMDRSNNSKQLYTKKYDILYKRVKNEEQFIIGELNGKELARIQNKNNKCKCLSIVDKQVLLEIVEPKKKRHGNS